MKRLRPEGTYTTRSFSMPPVMNERLNAMLQQDDKGISEYIRQLIHADWLRRNQQEAATTRNSKEAQR